MALFSIFSIESFQQELGEFEDALDRVENNLDETIDLTIQNTALTLSRDIRNRVKNSEYIKRHNTERSNVPLHYWDYERVGSEYGEFEVFTTANHAKVFEYGSRGGYYITGSPWLSWNPEERTNDWTEKHQSEEIDLQEEGASSADRKYSHRSDPGGKHLSIGDNVFYESVEHPGVEGQHFLRKAMNWIRRRNKMSRDIADNVESLFDREMRW